MRLPNSVAAVLCACAIASLCGRGRAEDSTQFRGTDGSGVVANGGLPLTWSETDHIRWKRRIPGRGWSSPVHADGKIWLTTAKETPLSEEEVAALKKKLASQPLGSAMGGVASVSLYAVEVDAASGALLRQVPLMRVAKPPVIHGLNSYASPTPVLSGGKLLCHFGTYGTACIDVATGKKLWERKLQVDHMVGPGSSPIVVDDLAIIPCDGGDKQFVAALDMGTGETRWQTDRPPIRDPNPDQRKAFSTPLAIYAAGREMVVIPGAQWFIAYDPLSGDEIWRVDHGSGFSNVPRPVFDGERVFLGTGFMRSQVWAVRPDGAGDVSATHVAWKQMQAPTMPSPVVASGRVYMVSDNGVASCMNAETGEVVWKERIGGNFSASLLAGAGRIYFPSQDGRVTVVAAGDEFKKLAINQLEGELMASPAAIDGDLLLRTDTSLYRIGGD